jgi:putative spermidine/putrescine transport system substrate-binding protein
MTMRDTTGKAVKPGIARRQLLAGTSAALLLSSMPRVVRAADKALAVGVYGGYFQDSFDKYIFPEFTKSTGITVKSVSEPTGETWVIQLMQAARAGLAPADVSMMAQVPMLKGIRADLWTPLDLAKIPNSKNIIPRLINRYADERACGIGAVTWYSTLCSNTKVFPVAPTSWAEFWDPKHKDQLGLLANVTNSYLLEITAKTYFGGTGLLDTDEGILKAFAKLAELKPNVRLWYRDEAQFEGALKSGEIPMGLYFHDVTGLAAKDGFPVRSTMPKEGGVQDSGSWAVTKASKVADLAHVFIDYMSQPSIQALLSRNLGTAPTVPRALTDLTDAEFNAVSSDIEPITPRYDIYAAKPDFLNQKWTEMIVG